MRRLLQKAHLYSPSAFAGLVDIFDPQTEDLKIEDTDKQEWALIPAGDIGFPTEDLNFVRRVFSFPIRYRYLRAPYVPGKRLLAHLNSRWTKRDIIGGFQLYENAALRLHSIKQALVLLCYKRRAQQKGQCESWVRRKRAILIRRVAIEAGLCRSARARRTARLEVKRKLGGA